MLSVKPIHIPTDITTYAFHYLTEFSIKDLKSFLAKFGFSFEDEFYSNGTSYYTSDTHEKLVDRTYIVLSPDKSTFTLIPYYKFWATYAPTDFLN